jgi:glycosyltransferase involved in cell wall biosynthesis
VRVRLHWFLPRFHTNLAPLVRELVRQGHEVRLDVLGVGRSEDHRVVTPQVVPAPERSVAGFRSRLRAWRADAAIVRDPDLREGRAAAEAALAERVPLVLYTQRPVRRARTVRETLLSPGWWPWRIRRVPAFSPVPGDARFGCPWPWLTDLPFAADPERAAKRDFFAGDAVHVLSVGKFMARKNHAALIAAFERVADRERVTLTLIGARHPGQPHALADVQAQVAASRHRDAIRVLLEVPPAMMAEHYLAADLFILPSRDEPAAVSHLEAMTHGVPVLCSRGNGTAAYVGDGGRIFDETNPARLLDALSTAVADRSWMTTAGANARRIARSTHHPERIAAGLWALIARATHGR